MFKHLVALIITLQLLAGSALAAKTSFIDGNAALRQPGTKVTADFLNKVNNHRHDGKAVDGSGVLDYAVATGSGNAIAITLSPALTAHVEGMVIHFKAAADNTGPATLAVNGMTPVPILKDVSHALEEGDIHSGQIVGVSWAGSAYQLIYYQPRPPTDAVTLQGQSAAQLVPPGAVMSFAMPTVPSGWLQCNGQAVLRASYPALFSAIGTAYGAGDNVSTFNLPDLRGEFLRGWDSGRGVDAGRAIGSWQADEFKSHVHPTTTPALIQDTNSGSDPHYIGDLGDSGAVGGTETRPRNVAILYCIKY